MVLSPLCVSFLTGTTSEHLLFYLKLPGTPSADSHAAPYADNYLKAAKLPPLSLREIHTHTLL